MRLPLPLLFLLWPLAEIATFVAVGGRIGVAWTLLLVLASGVAGLLVLRRQTLSTLRSLQASARSGRIAEHDVGGGALRALAAVLLIVPGFLSDALAVLLLLPPVRRVLLSLFMRGLAARVGARGGMRPRAPERRAEPTILELDADEFARHRGENGQTSPWREPGER